MQFWLILSFLALLVQVSLSCTSPFLKFLLEHSSVDHDAFTTLWPRFQTQVLVVGNLLRRLPTILREQQWHRQKASILLIAGKFELKPELGQIGNITRIVSLWVDLGLSADTLGVKPRRCPRLVGTKANIVLQLIRYERGYLWSLYEQGLIPMNLSASLGVFICHMEPMYYSVLMVTRIFDFTEKELKAIYVALEEYLVAVFYISKSISVYKSPRFGHGESVSIILSTRSVRGVSIEMIEKYSDDQRRPQITFNKDIKDALCMAQPYNTPIITEDQIGAPEPLLRIAHGLPILFQIDNMPLSRMLSCILTKCKADIISSGSEYQWSVKILKSMLNDKLADTAYMVSRLYNASLISTTHCQYESFVKLNEYKAFYKYEPAFNLDLGILL